MRRRLPFSVVPSGRTYAARLDPQMTIGDLAAYLTNADPSIDASTLEAALPVALDERVSQLDLAPGDRVALLGEAVQPAELPLSLKAGDRAVTIRSGDVEVRAAASRQIVLGKPDEQRGSFPDVDLRMFLPAETMDFISRDCLRLQFSDGRWYAQRSGQTRIVIDDFELQQAPVLLNDGQRVRFYRATETDIYARPLGSIDLLISAPETRTGHLPLRSGSLETRIQTGSERGTHFLNASEYLTVRQIAAALAHYGGQAPAEVNAFVLRLLDPGLTLQAALHDAAFVYVRMESVAVRYVLLLKDVNHPERIYQLAAGQGSERMRIGWYSGQQTTQIALDLDLSESLSPHLEPAAATSPVKAWMHFTPSDHSWSIRAEETGKTGVFVNSTRIGAAPLRLNKGDVILFGLTPGQSFARFQIDFRAEHGTG